MMAFLKMQFALWESIEVEQIAGRVGEHPHRVIGALGAIWRWFSEQTETGSVKVADGPELAIQWVDRKSGLPGLGAAMRSVEWLDISADGTVSVPDFEAHIGSAKKARKSAASRMRKVRARRNSEPFPQKPERPSPRLDKHECSGEHSGERSGERSARVFYDSDSVSVSVFKPPHKSGSSNSGVNRPPKSRSTPASPLGRLKAEVACVMPSLGQLWIDRLVQIPERLLGKPEVLLWVEKFLDKQEVPIRSSDLQSWLEETLRLLVQGKSARAIQAWRCAVTSGWAKPGWHHKATDQAIEGEPEPFLLAAEVEITARVGRAVDKFRAAQREEACANG